MSSFVNATAKADLGAIVDELILGGMKVSHKNLVMHMAIGSIVTCFLTGIVIMQVSRERIQHLNMEKKRKKIPLASNSGLVS